MLKADRVPSLPRTAASELHLAANRIRLSQMIGDPFVSAAFREPRTMGLRAIKSR